MRSNRRTSWKKSGLVVAVATIVCILLFENIQQQQKVLFIDPDNLQVEKIDRLQIYDQESNHIYTLDRSTEFSSIVSQLNTMNELNTFKTDFIANNKKKVIFQIYIILKGYYPSAPIVFYEDGTVLNREHEVYLDSRAMSTLKDSIKMTLNKHSPD